MLWFYGRTFLGSKKLISIVLSTNLLLSIVAISFQSPKLKEMAPSGFNVTYASMLKPMTPFYPRKSFEYDLINWFKNYTSKSDRVILTNINSRHIGAALNLPQKHFVLSTYEYNHGEGFSINNLDSLQKKIRVNGVLGQKNGHSCENLKN